VIIRHPVAVALATYNALASGGSVPDLTLGDLIEHWLICYEIFQADAAHLQRLSVVRYEDFVAHPQRTLDALHAFLGAPPHPCSEDIQPHANARYLAQWRAMCQNPSYQPTIARTMRLEERILPFGYSLMDEE